MYRPLHIPIDSAEGRRRRSVIVALVAVLHVALIYAIVSGLATRIVLSAPSILTAEILPAKQEAPPPAPAVLQLEQPTLPTVAAPVIRIAPSQPVTSTITVLQGSPRP